MKVVKEQSINECARASVHIWVKANLIYMCVEKSVWVLVTKTSSNLCRRWVGVEMNRLSTWPSFQTISNRKLQTTFLYRRGLRGK